MSPQKFRMTPAVLYVLLSLSEGARHGYAILSDVEKRSGGEASLGPSSLYYTLGRLADEGLISETHAPAEEEAPHAEQRRYFEITEVGQDRLRAELAVLRNIVKEARGLGLEAN